MKKPNMVGTSAALAAVLEHTSLLATIDRPILIQGERGTGKELIAERLHYLSARWGHPFIKINCAAFTETLLDSELFGHEAGAFTGARKAHIGRFERAQGGTLLLDELGTMSAQLQEKLLRVIEYGEFERVGGTHTRTCDVRVIGATHDHLPTLAEQGRFRWDLLDRLSFDVIAVPPLRARAEDIAELADYFAIRLSHELQWADFPGFSQAAYQQLAEHRWPGNVRELRNVVERSVFHHNDPDHLVDQLIMNPFATASTATSAPAVVDKSEVATLSEQALPADFNLAVDHYKKGLLVAALRQHRYQQTRTADALGLSYDQLRHLIRKYQLSTSAD